jgi:hypothetical protein
LVITSEQAHRLGVPKGTQISPYLEACCLCLSANVSYAAAERDIALLTGMRVSQKTQQRLVQRQDWESIAASMPSDEIHEMSIDGGQVRLTSGSEAEAVWRQYKAVRFNGQGEGQAWFQANDDLVAQLQKRQFNEIVACQGDGHDGIWNLHAAVIVEETRRFEILDWYHLSENLHKVPATAVDIEGMKRLLWQGDVTGALAQLKPARGGAARCFRDYLLKHQHRIINYEFFCRGNFCSVGSGAVESLVKQIDRRLQISGSRWKPEHVPKALAHRCAYLNGAISPTHIILSRR